MRDSEGVLVRVLVGEDATTYEGNRRRILAFLRAKELEI